MGQKVMGVGDGAGVGRGPGPSRRGSVASRRSCERAASHIRLPSTASPLAGHTCAHARHGLRPPFSAQAPLLPNPCPDYIGPAGAGEASETSRITQTRRGVGAGAAAALTLVLVAVLTVAAAVDDDVGASAAPALVLVLDLAVAAMADDGSTDDDDDDQSVMMVMMTVTFKSLRPEMIQVPPCTLGRDKCAAPMS